MKFSAFVVSLLMILALRIQAQMPPICGNTPAMKSFCRDACIICDIDGFTGRNNSNVTGQAPPGFCTSQVHNMQWIGFIAGSSEITLEVKVTNCVRNLGLEIGLYESLNCNSFRLVSECDTDVRPNTTRIFKNTVPLTVGQYYYFVMDGSSNDICDWTIKVTKGSTKVAPLAQTPDIVIPEKICQNKPFEIRTPGISGATFYNWTLDGEYLKNEKLFTHTIPQPGKYQLCLEAANVCDKSPKTCKTIEVLPTPMSQLKQEICFGECFKFHGIYYCTTGVYEVRFPAANGCDSIIMFDLKIAEKITAFTTLNICEGDTLRLGNVILTTQGKHEVIIQNQEGCDIFMTVDLKLIICNIKASISSTPVKCTGENNGSVHFMVDRGTPPFTYKGFKIENPSIVFAGKVDDVNLNITINQLDEGNYTFTIDDTYGNSRILNVFVSQPSKLKAQIASSKYNGGYQISCFGRNDGFYKIIPTGSIPPYTFRHAQSVNISDSLSGLYSGKYMVTVTDLNGCTHVSEINITQPDSLTVDVLFTNPDCSSAHSGSITVKSIKGGVQPYQYALNNDTYSDKNEFVKLGEGFYKLGIKDANQCQVNKEKSLVAAEIPIITNEVSERKVALGDSVLLDVKVNLSNYSLNWSPSEKIFCPKCIETFALPLNRTDYEIEVKSKDGCIAKSVIRVSVEKKRQFTISNIFSPNGDLSNDKIKIFTGRDVASIYNFSIYDRWGNLVYKSENLPSGLVEIDWDTKVNRLKLSGSLYVWVARVGYIDDLIKVHSGSILILD